MEPLGNGVVRNSFYVTVRSGVKLAVDLYLPEKAEQQGGLPVIVYNGLEERRDRYTEMKDFVEKLCSNAYAVAIMEPRGVGASFGHNEGFFTEQDGQDTADVIEYLAAREWCSGRAGMFGGSNKGNIQQQTASCAPKSLKIIIPNDCNADFYYQNYPNGASSLPLFEGIMPEPKAGTPVDEDTDGRLAELARTEHRDNKGFLGQYRPNMERDTVNPDIGYAPNLVIPVWNRMDTINRSGIFVYQCASWYDPGVTGELIAHRHWGGKLLIGPWRHYEMYGGIPYTGNPFPGYDFDWMEDHLRAFDCILKDVENGFLQESPVCWYTMHAPAGREWQKGSISDLSGQQRKIYELQNFDTEGVFLKERITDKSSVAEISQAGRIDYQTRDDIVVFPRGGLDRMLGGSFASQQGKCLAFASMPMSSDTMEILGAPSVRLWISSSYRDGNFLCILEEVKKDGTSEFITNGAIRASHAKVTENADWDALNIPYHAGLTEELQWLNEEEPMLLYFHLEATAYRVQPESRLRLSVFCGAEGTYTQPAGFPEGGARIALWYGGRHDTGISIPVSGTQNE